MPVWAYVGAAGISGASTIISSRNASRSSDRATQAALAAQQQANQTQSESDREALDFLKEQYRRRLEEDEPFRQFRSQALEELRMLLGMGSTYGPAYAKVRGGRVPGGPIPPGLFDPLQSPDTRRPF